MNQGDALEANVALFIKCFYPGVQWRREAFDPARDKARPSSRAPRKEEAWGGTKHGRAHELAQPAEPTQPGTTQKKNKGLLEPKLVRIIGSDRHTRTLLARALVKCPCTPPPPPLPAATAHELTPRTVPTLTHESVAVRLGGGEGGGGVLEVPIDTAWKREETWRMRVVIVCVDASFFFFRPPARGDARCLGTCAEVCLCPPPAVYDTTASRGERVREDLAMALRANRHVIIALCTGCPQSLFEASNWLEVSEWESAALAPLRFMLQSASTVRVFDARHMRIDPGGRFRDNDPQVAALHASALRQGRRELGEQSSEAQALRQRWGRLDQTLEDIGAAKRLVLLLTDRRRKLQVKSMELKLKIDKETATLSAAIASYARALPSLRQSPGPEFTQEEADQEMEVLEAKLKYFSFIVESYCAAANRRNSTKGCTSPESKEVIRLEENLMELLISTGSEVHKRREETEKELMFELFGAASTVEQALYTFKKDPELVLKLQELKVELRLEKTLREDLRLMSAFLFEDVRPVSEFQAHEEEEQWRANVLSPLLVHIFECLYLWPFFAEPLGAGCNHN